MFPYISYRIPTDHLLFDRKWEDNHKIIALGDSTAEHSLPKVGRTRSMLGIWEAFLDSSLIKMMITRVL